MALSVCDEKRGQKRATSSILMDYRAIGDDTAHLHPFRSSRHFSGTAPALGRSLKVESCLAYEHEKERLDSPAEEVRETRYSPVPRRWKGQIGRPSLSRNEDSVIWNPAIFVPLLLLRKSYRLFAHRPSHFSPFPSLSPHSLPKKAHSEKKKLPTAQRFIINNKKKTAQTERKA